MIIEGKASGDYPFCMSKNSVCSQHKNEIERNPFSEQYEKIVSQDFGVIPSFFPGVKC